MPGNRRRGIVTQPRDLHLLAEIDVMRIIDRETAKVIGTFHSTSVVNKRLLALVRAGLLRRFFVGSVAHGRKAIYTLSPRGGELVNAKFGGIRRASNRLIVSDGFVEHQTGINEIYVALKYSPRPAGVDLNCWRTFRQPISDAIKLTPDGYFELSVSGNVVVAFLEVDLGTEGLSVWQHKISSYIQLAISGEFTKRFHQPQFRVLVVANSDRRLSNIQKVISKSTDKIFWFATLDIINREGIWSSVWLRPRGDQRLPLL